MGRKVKDMIALLEQNGWVHIRTRGSHRIFKHPATGKTTVLAGKESKELDKSIENAILKQTGLKYH
jgi:predicted RNA binding protein YcfA (HicA-like mRNA interferase family)